MIVDIEVLKSAASVIQAALTAGVGLYLHLELRDRARGQQVEALRKAVEDRLDRYAIQLSTHEARISALPSATVCSDHIERIAGIEARAVAGPSHADLGAIHQRLDEQTAQISEAIGGMRRLESLLDTMHQHLLSSPRARKKTS